MITWWMYAVLASLVWGIHYNLIAKAMTVASPFTIYAIPNIILIGSLPLWYKVIVNDFHSVMNASGEIKAAIGAIMFTSIIGTVAAYKAIHSSNATIASLIEITYPVFVAIFAAVLFHENHLNWPIAIGGTLIMIGTGVIIYFHG